MVLRQDLGCQNCRTAFHEKLEMLQEGGEGKGEREERGEGEGEGGGKWKEGRRWQW